MGARKIARACITTTRAVVVVKAVVRAVVVRAATMVTMVMGEKVAMAERVEAAVEGVTEEGEPKATRPATTAV